MVSRGQASETYCYHAAKAAEAAARDAGVLTHVYMLYDSDKAGRVAAAKIEEKLNRYSNYPVDCDLLAVTDQQIHEWQLPTRPEKQGDGEAVELDAIPPDTLRALIESAITSHVDVDAWEKELAVEASERQILERIAA
jgi:hypothetical protein